MIPGGQIRLPAILPRNAGPSGALLRSSVV